MLLPGPRLRLLLARLCLSVPCYSLSLTPSGILMPQAETIRLSFYNSKHPITKTTGKPLQSYIKVALIGSKSPPQKRFKKRVAGLPRSRQTGNTLFESFLGRGGEKGKAFLESLAASKKPPQNLANYKEPNNHRSKRR